MNNDFKSNHYKCKENFEEKNKFCSIIYFDELESLQSDFLELFFLVATFQG